MTPTDWTTRAVDHLDDDSNDDDLEVVIEAAIAAAVAEEREACAKLAENPPSPLPRRAKLAAAIRARGQPDSTFDTDEPIVREGP